MQNLLGRKRAHPIEMIDRIPAASLLYSLHELHAVSVGEYDNRFDEAWGIPERSSVGGQHRLHHVDHARINYFVNECRVAEEVLEH